jgi:DNA repair photolyase
MLNESKGNMYSFISHTFNPIKGKCSHGCEYCYMKRFALRPLHISESEMKTDLGTGNFIFIGSCTDVFAYDVPTEWIEARC